MRDIEAAYKRGDLSSNEYYMLNTFVESPEDTICRLLDAIDENVCRKLLCYIYDIADYYVGHGSPHHPDDLLLLEVLAARTTSMIHQQIELALRTRSTPRTRKTFSRRLRFLEEKGFIEHPHGERKGVAITSKGLARLEQLRAQD